MSLERIPDEGNSLHSSSAANGGLPRDLGPHMDRVFRYVLRRGLLFAVFLHPFFKALSLLNEYDETKQAEIDIPIMPLALRWFLPFKVRLSLKDGELSLSVHLFWNRLERLSDRILARSKRISSGPQILKILGNIFTGQRVGYRDLRGAPRAQILALITLMSLVPSFLALIFYPPLRTIWILLRSLSTFLKTALRPVPALLAILVIMFATGDAWRMFGLQPMPRIVTLAVVLMGLTLVAVLLAMKSPDVSWRMLLGYPGGGSEILRSWALKTPAKKLVSSGVSPIMPLSDPHSPELVDDKEIPQLAHNISNIYRLTVVVNIIGVAFWLSMAFIVVGVIVVSGTMTEDLSHAPADVLLQFNLFGQSYVLTRQLVLLSITLGCIAALTLAAGTLQSDESRKAFFDSAMQDLRKSIGAFAYYLGTLMAFLIELHRRGIIDELTSVDRASLDALLNLIKGNSEDASQ